MGTRCRHDPAGRIPLDETARLDNAVAETMRTDNDSAATAGRASTKRRLVNAYHRYLANPLMRPVAGRLSGQALLETTGRRTGLPRRTPVGGRIIDGSFWLVSNHGRHSDYVRNLAADPNVRLLHQNRSYPGVAHILDDDDPRQRLVQLPRFTSFFVRLLGTNLTTVRIDLAEEPK
jgi:deazaflavin-dependent oxidoreductase (nitroreductase family)